MFSAIQGEGPWVGQRQIFVRLLGCDLKCLYCDTPDTHAGVRAARLEQTAGARDWQAESNPMSVAVAQAAIERLNHPQGLHRSVALTGGEPLLYAPFLAELLPALKASAASTASTASAASTGLAIYLETHGLAVEAMQQLAPHVDYVSMDWKIASATGEPVDEHRHHAFLNVLAGARVPHYVKLVVVPATTDEELLQAARHITDVDPATVTVLQPVTPYGPVTASPTPEQMLHWQALLSGVLADVRVIPQTHVQIGQL